MNPSYNDSFGSFSNGGTPVANGGGMMPNGGMMSNGGEMVPNGGMMPNNGAPVVIGVPEKKSKKWILVLVGVFVAVAVVVLVVLSLMPRGKSNNNSTASLSEAMSEYMNLVVNEEVEEVSTVDYYNKLIELLNKIEAGSGGNDTVSFLVDSSKELWAYYFVAMTLVYSNADYNYYFKNGNLDGFLSEYGYPFEETDDNFMMALKATADALVGAKKAFYDAVSETNCVVDNGIDYVCLSDLNSGKIEETQSLEAKLNYNESVQAKNILKLAVAKAKSLNRTIGGVEDE